MATANSYRCDVCGYEAMVVGGREGIEAGILQTYRCKKCDTLFDELAWSAATQKKIRARCPDCNSKRVTEWSRHDPACPKCGYKMWPGGTTAQID